MSNIAVRRRHRAHSIGPLRLGHAVSVTKSSREMFNWCYVVFNNEVPRYPTPEKVVPDVISEEVIPEGAADYPV